MEYNSIIEFQISNEHTFTNLSLSTLRDLIEVSKIQISFRKLFRKSKRF